jgi:anaerobic selenocysteine-containing dehydrogenase
MFPTPDGKVQLRCDVLAREGIDPLPAYEPPAEVTSPAAQNGHLMLISGASHHFVSSSLANQPSLLKKEGPPFIEINPADAAQRDIKHGDTVRVASERGWCLLRAVVSADVPPGVTVAPKGQWAQFAPEWRNINWVTPDALGDLAGQSTFHSNLVTVELEQAGNG